MKLRQHISFFLTSFESIKLVILQYQTMRSAAAKHIIRFITLVVALQLLNLSIYAQDFTPLYAEDGTCGVNISETVVEYVVEVVLGHKDAIPEQSQHHKDLHFHKHVSFNALSFGAYRLPETSAQSAAKPESLEESYSCLYCCEINPPPPKA
jgi:hypothetical protein